MMQQPSLLTCTKSKGASFLQSVRKEQFGERLKRCRDHLAAPVTAEATRLTPEEFEDAFAQLERLASGELRAGADMGAYYHCFVVRQFLQDLSPAQLSDVAVSVARTRKHELLFALLRLLAHGCVAQPARGGRAPPSPRIIAINEIVCIAIALFSVQEAVVATLLSRETVRQLLELLTLDSLPLAENVFFALKNAATGNASLAPLFHSTDALARAAAAFSRLTNDPGCDARLLSCQYAGLVSGLLNVGLASDRPAFVYARLAVTCLAQAAELCAGDEEQLLQVVEQCAYDAGSAEMCELVDSPDYARFLSRLADIFTLAPNCRTSAARIVTNITGSREDEFCLSVPEHVLLPLTSQCLLSDRPHLRHEALLTLTNVLITSQERAVSLLRKGDLLPSLQAAVERPAPTELATVLRFLDILLAGEPCPALRSLLLSRPTLVDALLRHVDPADESVSGPVLRVVMRMVESEERADRSDHRFVSRVAGDSQLCDSVRSVADSAQGEARGNARLLLSLVDRLRAEASSSS